MATQNGNTAPQKLNILTLNCWGLKFIAKHRNARLTEIGNQIAMVNPQPDIVGLQECWTQQDYLAIRDKTRHILPYGKFYHSGIFGGGLAILSRWPIEESNMVRYPLNGRPAAFYRGDWFVGKGVACARIRMGPARSDIAEVFCTHLHAPYEAEPHDSYICHRTAQAWEIAKLMRHASERGHLVIALGDFNMLPLSLAHKLIEAHTPCRDVWRLLYAESSIGSAHDPVEQKRGVPMPSAQHNIDFNGATCDSTLNTWRWDKRRQKDLDKGRNHNVNPSDEDPRAKRLDYIFVASGERPPVLASDSSPFSADWAVFSARVGMTGRHPELLCSLSDHFSVECTLTRSPMSASPERPPPATSPLPPTSTYLPLNVYDAILAMTEKYHAREYIQRKLRLAHLGFQLALSIGCHIAIWWSPRAFVSFLLMLLSTVGLSVGVVDGLMGGLFVGSEVRALKEFAWEVRCARKLAEEKEVQDGLTAERLSPTGPQDDRMKQ